MGVSVVSVMSVLCGVSIELSDWPGCGLGCASVERRAAPARILRMIRGVPVCLCRFGLVTGVGGLAWVRRSL